MSGGYTIGHVGATWAQGPGDCLASEMIALEKTTAGYKSWVARDGGPSDEDLRRLTGDGLVSLHDQGQAQAGISLTPMGWLAHRWLHQHPHLHGGGLGPVLSLAGEAGHGQIMPMLGEKESLAAEVLTRSWEAEGMLRDYQGLAVRLGLGMPWGRGALALPTGSGKTRIALGLLVAMQRVLGIKRVLYLVTSQDLARQTAEAFRPLDGEFRQVADQMGLQAPVDGQMAVCSIRTAAGWGDAELRSYGGVVLDEAHSLLSDGRVGVLGRLRAVCRVGLTATPDARQDGRNALLVAAVGPVVDVAAMGDLVDSGYLADGLGVIE